MIDAFDRGDTIHHPGIGYKLEPKVDEFGNPVLKPNGVRKNKIVIDSETSQAIVIAFRLYAERKNSPDKIARFFNRRQIDGKQTWDGTRIRSLISLLEFASRGEFSITSIL